MTSPPVDRTDALMVRLWIEPGHATNVRARIARTANVDASPRVEVVGSVDEICAIVRTWVEDVAAVTDPEVATIEC